MDDSEREKDPQLIKRLQSSRPSQDYVDGLLLENLRAALLSKVGKNHKIGRFTLIRPIGSGAHGTVYAAQDPSLGRRVAIKVLSSPAVADAILKEAKALAQLQHPNVLKVHDVFEDAVGVCLVMEEVKEGNLDKWLLKDRSTEDTLRAFVQAGNGLCAVHRAGLIHGDIKPQNILVGEDGAKVADFGLAFEAERGLCRVGTVAYAAPELLRGEKATALSDQYAFFAALKQALSGKDLPQWVMAALQRGMHEDPRKRFVDMHQASESINAPARRRRRRTAWVLAVVCVVMCALGFFFYREGADAQVCNGKQLYRTAWNDVRLAQLKNMDPLRSPPLIDKFEGSKRAWLSEHRLVCQSQAEYALQTPSEREGRLACLTQQLREVDVLVTQLLSSGSHSEFSRAQRYQLPSAMECRSQVDGALGSASVGDETATARGHFALGQYDRASKLASAIDDSKASPLQKANLSLLLGEVSARQGKLKSAETHLRKALSGFVSLEHAHLRGKTALALMKNHALSGDSQRAIVEGELVEGLLFGDLQKTRWHVLMGEAYRLSGKPSEAAAQFEQASPGILLLPTEQALLHMNIGSLALAVDKVPRAKGAFKTALGLVENALGPKHPGRALYLNKLGDALLAAGEDEEALVLQGEALAIREHHYGKEDPATASSLLRMCNALLQAGKLNEAKSACDRALGVRQTLFDETHAKVAQVRLSLGKVAEAQGFLSLALIEFEKADSNGQRWVRLEAQARMLLYGAKPKDPISVDSPESLSELRLKVSQTIHDKDLSVLPELQRFAKGRGPRSYLVVVEAFFALSKPIEGRDLAKMGLKACGAEEGGLQRALRELLD